MRIANKLAEGGWLSDGVIRLGIRYFLNLRLKEINAESPSMFEASTRKVLDAMTISAIADVPEKANEQHYEVPAEFFLKSLGGQLKYSCGFWPNGTVNLDASEEQALRQTTEHAALQDGQNVLELGCGWGSLTLYMASNYPNSKITAVSNSKSQAVFIKQRAQEQGIHNVEVLTVDMNEFETESTFDRIVSVEMFEHMRNWEQLFAKVSRWLTLEGQFFMHVFAHKSVPYFFEDKGDSDWMSRYFFSGGLMPSYDLPLAFAGELTLQKRWKWNGSHYARTSNAWLKKMDENKEALLPLFSETYGVHNAKIWWMRWRMFYMACAELFAYNEGNEWFVGHYLFLKKEPT